MNLNNYGSLDLDFGEHDDHSVSLTWRKDPWYQDDDDAKDDIPNFVIAELLLLGWMILSPTGSFNIGDIPESMNRTFLDRYSPHQKSFIRCVERCIAEVDNFTYCSFPYLVRNPGCYWLTNEITGDKSSILASKLVKLAKVYDDLILDFQLDLIDCGLSEYFNTPPNDIMVISESRNFTLIIPYTDGSLSVSVLGIGSKRQVTWPESITNEGLDVEAFTNLKIQLDRVNLIFYQIKWILRQLVASAHCNFKSVMSCTFDVREHEYYKCYQRQTEPIYHHPLRDISEVDFVFSFTPKTPE